MAKGEKKPPKGKDRHASGFMIRFPEAYREAMNKLKAKTRRTITVEAQIALDKHLKENGIEPPDQTAH